MNIVLALARVPWGKIIASTPPIIEAARGLLKKKDDVTLGLQERIKILENNQVQQTDLISKMANHIQDLSNSLQVIAARVTIFILISIVALVLSLFIILKKIFL